MGTIKRSPKGNKNKFASRSSKSTSIRRALQKINLPQGHRNRPHQRRHPSKRGTKSCLEVNEIDFTKKHTARNNLIPRSQQNRLHQRRLPKRSKNVSQGQRNRLYHKKSTAKNKFASRSPKSTSPTRAPIKREANKKNQKESS